MISQEPRTWEMGVWKVGETEQQAWLDRVSRLVPVFCMNALAVLNTSRSAKVSDCKSSHEGEGVLAWRWFPSNNTWTTKGINASAPFNHLGRVNEMLGGLIISKPTYALLLNLMRSLRNALLEGKKMIKLRMFSKIPRFMCRGASVFTRTTTDLNYLWI